MYLKDGAIKKVKDEVIMNIVNKKFEPKATRGQLSVLYSLNIIDAGLYNNLRDLVDKEEIANGET